MQNGRDALFQTMVDEISNEIFLIDPDSAVITYANKALLEDIQYNTNDLSKFSWMEIFTEEHRDFISENYKKVLLGRKDSLSFQADLLRRDGSYHPAQIQLSSYNQNGNLLILGICQDISIQKRNHELLEIEKKKTRELQLNIKYKSAFFANLSHEMRTTLNSVLLLSEILTENRTANLSEEQLKYSQTIHNSTNSMLFLLNEVLDMSKLESGKMSMRPELVEIYDFCKELERLFQPVASEKGIKFEFVYDIEESIPFRTDRMRLEQVLKNLISNALKFTPKGSVILRVFSPKSGQVHFQVIDTGIGISETQQRHIFESYRQAEDINTENHFRGTGLGLAITNEIVSLLGGKISLESSIGKGSTFTAELPQDSSDAILKNATAGKIKLSTAPAKGDRIPELKKSKPEKIQGTILLVDDNETHNMALSEFLSFKVEECLTADSAKNAFVVLNKEQVSCIILDMYLPDASGKEVLQKLKKNDELSDIPVIIYSGKNISQEEEQELENMADAIIQKNVMSYKVLLAKVTGVLHKANEPMG